jgi:hypothetical protein
MALRILGRLKTTVAMRSSRSTWIRSLMTLLLGDPGCALGEERVDGGGGGLVTLAPELPGRVSHEVRV